jgi:2-C-methyl-D-erythritol 4-phosphate cytidylyltransferase
MNTIIITAGGFGKRMGSALPKQFLCINGKAILMHTIEAFFNYNSQDQILVTLPADWHSHWISLCNELGFSIPHELIEGGEERFHSIQNALKHAKGNVIAVHDGVRPLVCITTIQRCFEMAEKQGSAVPVIPAKESVRWTKNNISKSVPRQEYVLVQTPQIFHNHILRKAYNLPFHADITDDASLVEKAGFRIVLVEGNEENLKITHPMDLKLAEILFNERKS